MNKEEIKQGLADLGLKAGDSVLLHSSFLSLGNVTGGPDAVVDAFLEILGDEGTLLVPTFGHLGIIPEIVKKRPGVVKSYCNGATVAAIGKNAEMLCHDHWRATSLHGKDTPYTRLADIGGFVCLLGVDQDRNTTLHSVEALLELPYLNIQSGEFTDEEGKIRYGEWKYFPGPHRDFIGLDPLLRESGKMKISRIGNAVVRLIRSKDLLDILLETGRRSPDFVLCDNPECADCISQRAALFYYRIKNNETFTLSASLRLAGRYVPEAVENLTNAGIRSVELDYLNRTAVWMMPPAKILEAVDEFSSAGISVSGIRLFHMPDAFPGLFSDMRVTGAIKRMIIPLQGSAAFASQAKSSGWQVDFFNQNQTSLSAAVQLRELDGRLVFNPANFAAAGEKPFLRSYSTGRFVKTISGLDIVDGLFDGTPAELARGNAEIKELISILRCSSFSGVFTLGGGSVFPGTLIMARNQFTRLLDEM